MKKIIKIYEKNNKKYTNIIHNIIVSQLYFDVAMLVGQHELGKNQEIWYTCRKSYKISKLI